MGQPEAASGTWGGQSRRFSPALSEAVGQPTARAGATYTAQQNELKILKALPRRSVEFLRKTGGIRCDFASCGTSVEICCWFLRSSLIQEAAAPMESWRACPAAAESAERSGHGRPAVWEANPHGRKPRPL